MDLPTKSHAEGFRKVAKEKFSKELEMPGRPLQYRRHHPNTNGPHLHSSRRVSFLGNASSESRTTGKLEGLWLLVVAQRARKTEY